MDIHSLVETYSSPLFQRSANSDVFNSVYLAKEEDSFQELFEDTSFEFVIIGLLSHTGDFSIANAIREQLYKLKLNDYKASILDIGNFIGTFDHHSNELADVLLSISQYGKKVILIGGEQEWTLTQTLSMCKQEKYFTLLNIDPEFDGFKHTPTSLSQSFLEQILKTSENYLFDYIHLAYQSYLVDELVLENFIDEEFEIIRLSTLREDIKKIEPLLRSSDIVSVDLRSVKYSDSPSVSNPLPNGLYGEEFCKILHYIGFSKRFLNIGFYNVEYNETVNFDVTVKQVAQAIWHLIDGFCSSTVENMDFKSDTYLKFLVLLEDSGQEIVFYKNVMSERWWMSIPDNGNSKNEHQNQVYYLPCSYADYTEAAEGNVPNRWIKAYNRINK